MTSVIGKDATGMQQKRRAQMIRLGTPGRCTIDLIAAIEDVPMRQAYRIPIHRAVIRSLRPSAAMRPN
jgi:hypothetical protein